MPACGLVVAAATHATFCRTTHLDLCLSCLPPPPCLPLTPHHPQDFYEDVFEELDKYGEVENLNVCDNVADHMVGNVYIKFRDEESAARCIAGLQVSSCFEGARVDLSPAISHTRTHVCVSQHTPIAACRPVQSRVGPGRISLLDRQGRSALHQATSCASCARQQLRFVYLFAVPLVQGRYYAGRPVNAEFSPVTDFREATCRQYEENTCNRGGYCNFMHIKPIGK